LDAQPDPATVVVKRISVSFGSALIGLIFPHFVCWSENGNSLYVVACRKRTCQFVRMIRMALPAEGAGSGQLDAGVQIAVAVSVDHNAAVVDDLKVVAIKRFLPQRADE